MVAAIFAAVQNEDQRNELEQFYSEYRDRLCWSAYSNLHDHCAAEDAIQKVFLEIANKPEKFFDLSPNERPAYVAGMVNKISMKMFNEKNNVYIEELDEDTEDLKILSENELLDKISRDEVLEFIDQLPAKQKEVLLLRGNGLTVYEISNRLGISMTTVNRRLKKARDAVKKFLDERDAGYE